jgi:VWFA-related protein
MSHRSAVAVALALTAAAALPQAQSARPAQVARPQTARPAQTARPVPAARPVPTTPHERGQFSAGTTAVLVDVVVRGKDGKPVTDLGARDFELREDDVVQEIGSFMRVSRGAGIAVNVGVRDPNPPTVVTGPSGSAPTDTAFHDDEYPSVTALVFDALSAEAVGMCQKAALEYLPMSGNSATRVGVFTTEPFVRALQVYTDDPSLVRNAVRKIIPAGTESKEQQREAMNEMRDRRALLETQVAQLQGAQQGGAAAAGAASGIGQTNLQLRLVQGQMRMLQAFDTMDRDQRGYVTTKSLFAILQSLNELPGRKTVIFFSEGLPSSPALRAHLRSVVESANRSNITVYAIDAAGLRTISGTADTRREIEEAGKDRMRQLNLGSLGEYTDQPMIRTIEKAEDMMRYDSQGGLAELAEDTGGFLVRDTNDLRHAFERIDEDQRFHYLLTYSPKNQKFDGTFRNISVKVARQNTQVFARKGYRALRFAPTLPVLDYEAPALAALDAARLSNGFPFETAALNFPEPTRPGLAPLVVRLKTDVLTYDEDAAKKTYDAQATIVVRVRDGEGRVVHKMSQQYQLTGRLHELASAKQGEILFFRAPELPAGLYTVESVVFDAIGARSSTRVVTLEVPPQSRRLQMSSVVCVNRVERVAAETRDPANPLYVDDMLLYPNGGEAYSRSGNKELTFFYTVYPGSSQGPLSANVELQRNGQVLAKMPVELTKTDAQGRIQQVGRLPLTAITPGTYQLHVIVTDGNSTLERTAYFQVVS